ncbi:hypothetical protein B5K05_03985 [Rhizobium phaseoli]|nr:hypothetical protein B5K04_03965 [Rhizobium phaseoli]RDJ18835.1 hypothetical protein B5K05_03985 [Rhizobium phaseoli]
MMTQLVDSKVMRKGVTKSADQFAEVTAEVEVMAFTLQGLVPWETGVQIRFAVPSKGGGNSEMIVDVGVADYEALARAMLLNNAPAALRAFAKAGLDHFDDVS